MEAASDGSLARLLEEIDSSDLLMDNCDDDDDAEGGGGGDKEEASMNLILVTNLNVRVVVCDCGRGYKIPQVTEVGGEIIDKEAAEPNNNCVVVIPDDDDDDDECSKKGRF